ncbi:hypothetical protein GYMLUDRAFT_258826, partial [Collybiopsis luxurians FD-317 M1]
MCYIEGSVNLVVSACPMCKAFPHPKCPHIREVCKNRTLHPRFDVLYLRNAEVQTFNSCGYCRWARSNPFEKSAINPGWPGCCRPPAQSEYYLIEAADWRSISIIYNIPIPPDIKCILSGFTSSNRPSSRQSQSSSGRAFKSLALRPTKARRSGSPGSPAAAFSKATLNAQLDGRRETRDIAISSPTSAHSSSNWKQIDLEATTILRRNSTAADSDRPFTNQIALDSRPPRAKRSLSSAAVDLLIEDVSRKWVSMEVATTQSGRKGLYRKPDLFDITTENLQYHLGFKEIPVGIGNVKRPKWTPELLVPYHKHDKSLVQQLVDVLQSDLDYTEQGHPFNLGMNLRVYHMRCLRSLRHLATKYEILPSSLFVQDLQRIGQNPIRGGGFADIWRGTTGSNQSVCLKVLRLILEPDEDVREKIRKQFCNEALVWRQLKHPNILPLIGVNVQLFDPSFCLVSPWMENKDIIAYLKRNPMHNRYSVLSEIAAGLLYLHSRDPPVIHGDIRGANILVTADLHCCLADFGLSVVSTESQIWSTAATTNVRGATRWMAPELQIPDSADKLASSSLSTDVYAFGCTIIEILTLQPPFNTKKNDGAVIHSLSKGERPARPQQNIWCTDSLWELMDRCWAQDPSARPDSQGIHDTLQGIRMDT